ncbi:MAG: DUF1015 domain-containing protein [Dehalococcoidia bacterium]|nr:DUF1015 domain-containing protein [Dehalococcoidia bacterium]
MTEIRPFRGLRYDPAMAPPSAVIAPPYDVVDGEDVRSLNARSPFNIAHVESCEASDAGYAQAAALLERWEREGALRRDEQPALYVYEQAFEVHGGSYVRRSFFARLQIHPHEDGIVRPHEATLTAAKEDRLRLLRATRTNVSPIFGMFEDAAGRARAVLDRIATAEPAFVAVDARGESHRLWPVTAAEDIDSLVTTVAVSNVTIADGHHRYHTALNYLHEREAAGDASEADRYILAGLVPVDDPGLVVLPIHRLIRRESVPTDLLARLTDLYDVERLDLPWSAEGVASLWARVQREVGSRVSFGAIGLEPQAFHVLTARSAEAIEAAMPGAWSAASRALHVLILNETVLQPLLGLDAAQRASGAVGYTEDETEAWREVDAGAYGAAFLVDHVHVRQIVAVADAGEVLPQKSTYFYPKLATGMVLNPLD